MLKSHEKGFEKTAPPRFPVKHVMHRQSDGGQLSVPTI